MYGTHTHTFHVQFSLLLLCSQLKNITTFNNNNNNNKQINHLYLKRERIKRRRRRRRELYICMYIIYAINKLIEKKKNKYLNE
jgi:hypothetical protein